MLSQVRVRFWVESVLALLSVVALVAVTVQPSWIETIFRVDPDAGSGGLEWAVAGAFLLLFVAFAVAARVEWRRTSRQAVA